MGFQESHHPWSKYGITYSPTQLLIYLTAFFIPSQVTKTTPDEPSMEVPNIPNLTSFGTMAPYVIALYNSSGNKVANIKQRAREY